MRMEFIALFFPACIAMTIRQKRGTGCEKQWFMVLLEYGRTVLWCNFLPVVIINYILGMDGVVSEALSSFSFFSKYIVIACVCSFLIPYVQEVVSRYIQIRFFLKEK